MRQRLMATFALLHLGFVVASVSINFGSLPSGLPRQGALTYCNLSGTFRDYTFFAPGVASALKAGFLVEDAGGGAPTLVTFGSESREVSFRYGSIMRSGMNDERGRDLFAQSWAALILGNEPGAANVTVMVERMVVPSMDEYRRGQRPQWAAVYAGKFDRRPAGPP
jgi:hypothetical protein